MRLIVVAVLVVLAGEASAGTDCTTRKSGSVTIETCSGTGRDSGRNYSQCRSYMSGSVRKTSCR